MSNDLNWDKLRIFQACAEAGSFTHAAKILKLTQSAISRQISALEYGINMQLFTRHARGLILTEQGEVLYEMTKKVMLQLKDVQEILSDSKNKPKGLLRITAPFGLGTHWLINQLPEFQKLYKEIRLDLQLADTEVDLAQKQADCALRLYEPVQNDLIRKHIFTITLHIYASTSYIKQYGVPTNLNDLNEHSIISYGNSVPEAIKALNWLEEKLTDKHKPRLQVNNLWAIKTAVKSGLGLAILPDYMVQPEDDLAAILTKNNNLPFFPTYFCYHESLRNSARIKAFSEFICTKAKDLYQRKQNILSPYEI